MKNKFHKWSFDVDEDTCTVCGVKRRIRNVILDRLNYVQSVTIREYFINGQWVSDNNQENKYCKGAEIVSAKNS
jgi:hypothetical protein